MTLKDMYFKLQQYEYNHEVFFKVLEDLMNQSDIFNNHGVLSERQKTVAENAIKYLMDNKFERVSSETFDIIQNYQDWNHELTFEEYTILSMILTGYKSRHFIDKEEVDWFNVKPMFLDEDYFVGSTEIRESLSGVFIGEKKIIVIYGEKGCGKTSLINILRGGRHGAIYLDDCDVLTSEEQIEEIYRNDCTKVFMFKSLDNVSSELLAKADRVIHIEKPDNEKIAKHLMKIASYYDITLGFNYVFDIASKSKSVGEAISILKEDLGYNG